MPRRGSATEFEPWVAGTLPKLTGVGYWRFGGPLPPASVEERVDAPVDAEVIEALRRLGYVGD